MSRTGRSQVRSRCCCEDHVAISFTAHNDFSTLLMSAASAAFFYLRSAHPSPATRKPPPLAPPGNKSASRSTEYYSKLPSLFDADVTQVIRYSASSMGTGGLYLLLELYVQQQQISKRRIHSYLGLLAQSSLRCVELRISISTASDHCITARLTTIIRWKASAVL